MSTFSRLKFTTRSKEEINTYTKYAKEKQDTEIEKT